ncbi:MAG: DUF2480 family protein [Bacteroidia bacterium]|nr:DUF2480 family protein [Bacteroidia bacterium]
MAEEIVNRIALSPLVTYDLADLYTPGERVFLDIKEQLFMEQLLREKDFRAYIASEDWEKYRGKHVAVGCSVDAIIPVWAYMMLATQLEPVAASVVFGDLAELEKQLFLHKLAQLDFTRFEGKKVVIKGCGDIHIPESVFVEATRRFRQVASKIMYGEPCSTVPVWKK